MATVLLIVFLVFIVKLFKRFFKPRRKRSRRREYTPERYYTPPGTAYNIPPEIACMPDTSGELKALEKARDCTQESIDYIDGLFSQDDICMNEKTVLYWINRQAALYKQLASIEKQIAKLQ